MTRCQRSNCELLLRVSMRRLSDVELEEFWHFVTKLVSECSTSGDSNIILRDSVRVGNRIYVYADISWPSRTCDSRRGEERKALCRIKRTAA